MLRSGRKYSNVGVRDKPSSVEDRTQGPPADNAVEKKGLATPATSSLSEPPRVGESLSPGDLGAADEVHTPAPAAVEEKAPVEDTVEDKAPASIAVEDDTPAVDAVEVDAPAPVAVEEDTPAAAAVGTDPGPSAGAPELGSPWQSERERKRKSRVIVGQDGTRHPVARVWKVPSVTSVHTKSSPRYFNTGFFMDNDDLENDECEEAATDPDFECPGGSNCAHWSYFAPFSLPGPECYLNSTKKRAIDNTLSLARGLASTQEQNLILKRMKEVQRMELQEPQSCSDSSPPGPTGTQAHSIAPGSDVAPTEIDPRAQDIPPKGEELHTPRDLGSKAERIDAWRNAVEPKKFPWVGTLEDEVPEEDDPVARTSANTFGRPLSIPQDSANKHLLSPEISLNATRVSIEEVPEKGKRRARGERPREDAQIDADRETAEELQRGLNRAAELGRLRAEMAIRATDLRKPAKRKIPWTKDSPILIEENSSGNPDRAFSQIPQNGYLWNTMNNQEHIPPSRVFETHQSRKSLRKENTPVIIRIESPIPNDAHSATDDASFEPSSEGSVSSAEPSQSSSLLSHRPTASSDSGSSPSSSSSSSASERKHRKRKAYKRKLKAKRKAALTRNIKYPEPAEYDGRPNLESYETFVFELKNWLKLSQMPSKYKMIAMKRFLTGNAGKHYMAFAAMNLREWTVDTYLIALFNHCFPPHFRSQMRTRFENCSQGGRSVREFIRELRTLGNRLNDVQEIHLRLRFWRGAAPYLRLEWAKAGLNAETSALHELELAAERFEMSENLRRREDNQSNANNGQNRTFNGGNRTPNHHQQRRRRRWEQRDRRNGSRERGNNGAGPSSSPRNNDGHQSAPAPKDTSKGKREWKPKKPEKRHGKLSKEDKDELRAANKCFTCKQTGHISKDCPTKNTMRKPTVGTMSFAEIDTLNQIRRDLPLGSMSIQFGDEGRNEELREARNRVFVARIRYQLEIHAPYAGDQFMPPVEGDRFEVTPVRRGAAFRIVDRMMANDTWDLDREFAEYDDFDAGENMQEMRQMLFISAGLNNDAMVGNMIVMFEDALNSPDSGLVDFDHPPPNERYPERRWAVRPTDHHQTLEIQDRYPYSDSDPLPGPFVVTRDDILAVNFDVVTYLHNARWNQRRVVTQLMEGAPYVGDYLPDSPVFTYQDPRWIITELNGLTTIILDRSVRMEYVLSRQNYLDPDFDVAKWMDEMKIKGYGIDVSISDEQNGPDSSTDEQSTDPVTDPTVRPDLDDTDMFSEPYEESEYYSIDEEQAEEHEVDSLPDLQSATESVYSNHDDGDSLPDLQSATESDASDGSSEPDDQRYDVSSEGDINDKLTNLYLGSNNLPKGSNTNGRKGLTPKVLDRLERNSAKTKDFERLVPSPIVVIVKINGHSARALLDTGSLADFISTRLVDQLSLPISRLEKPLTVQLAVTGSRSIINGSTTVEFEYQKIKEDRRFDVLNLENYDLILGTPFLFQHKLMVGFNPSKVAVGTDTSVPIVGEQVSAIPSRATDIYRDEIEKLRQSLKEEARGLCKNVAETALPPMRAVNHTIPLVDESKVYSWRPSRCPEAMKPLWVQKRDEYLKSGRWRFRTGNNAAPLLFLWKPKPGADNKKSIRTVVDKREQNANTVKMASPLPDMESILRNAASHPYRSSMDGKDAYEQIRIAPEHVHRSLFSTPDGTMESLVLQQGDCNGGATYQSLMNHIFAPYIGVFMDVYLDDLIIYSDTVEDHVKHIRLVLDVLKKQKLYLSWDKMNFFAEELNLLGHVVSDKGIRMDPNKVDSIVNWKTPTNKDLLAGFLGAVGYLAPGVQGVRIPMAILSRLTGSDKTFKWGPTEQRAFEQIKELVNEHRETHRVGIVYGENAPPINLVCDASLTGGGGHVNQGEDLQTAQTIAFWSGKFNPAQQNYPTHERELLAIVESLKRFKNLLLGTKFRIYTDHKALQCLMTQRNLSPRQARWLELLHEFDFDIRYLPGESNTLADSLSRIYSDEPAGVVRAPSEYISPDVDSSTQIGLSMTEYPSAYAPTRPLYTGPALFADLDAGLGMVDDGEGRKRSARAKRAPRKDDEIYNSPATKPPTSRKQMVDQTAEADTPAAVNPKANPNSSTLGSTAKEAWTSVVPLAGPSNPPLDGTVKSQRLRWRATVEEIEDEGSIIGDRPIQNRGSNPVTVVTQAPVINDTASDDSPGTSREPLASIVSSAEGIDIYESVRNSYKKDAFFREIFEHPEHFRNFELAKGLLYLRDGPAKMLCIPDILKGERKIREIIITHAHSILAHLSARKTIHYLREHVWWKTLASDVNTYCESCPTCASSKSRTTSQFGMLKTLEVPKRPWEAIGIDFVGPLPESRNRHGAFDMICVIIDHLTSLVHLVPTVQTYRAKDIAELIFDEVYKHHGLPERIISDRDSLFTSVFWKHLHKLIGTELRFSSAYHPQTDGATERANRTITQMLRQCIAPDQKDWVAKLPGIEFALNSARSDTTGFSPFYLNYGRVPDPMVWNSHSEYPGVRVFAQRMKDAIMAAHDAIIAARVKQTVQANKHRRPAPFDLNDLVYLSTENLALPKKRARKLIPKFIGPYRIINVKKPGSAYELELPADMMRRGIHPVYHASKLRLHVPNDDRRFPGRQLRQFSIFGGPGEESEWAVDRILNHFGKGTDALFQLRWKSGDTTWAQYRSIANLDALQTYLESLGIDGVTKLPLGKSAPPSDEEIFTARVSFMEQPYMEHESQRNGDPSNSVHIAHSRPTRSANMQSYTPTQPTTGWTRSEVRACKSYEWNAAKHEIRLFRATSGSGAPPAPFQGNKPDSFDRWMAENRSDSILTFVLESVGKRSRDLNEIGGQMIMTNISNLLSGGANNPQNAFGFNTNPYRGRGRGRGRGQGQGQGGRGRGRDRGRNHNHNHDGNKREDSPSPYGDLDDQRRNNRSTARDDSPDRDLSPTRDYYSDGDTPRKRYGPKRRIQDDSGYETERDARRDTKKARSGDKDNSGHKANKPGSSARDGKPRNDKRAHDEDGDARMNIADRYEAEERLGGKNGVIQTIVRDNKRSKKSDDKPGSSKLTLKDLHITQKPDETRASTPMTSAGSDFTEEEVAEQAAILVASPAPLDHADSPVSVTTETTIEDQAERME